MTTGVVSPPLIADDRSLAERLVAPFADLPPDERAAAFDALMADLGPTEAAYLMSWEGVRRPSQFVDPRNDALLVVLLGGRGSGKGRGGAEGVCDRIEADMMHHGAFISRTPGDVRRVMIEGDGGFMAACDRRGIRAKHTPTKTEIDIVDGGVINTYTAHQPEQLRGPAHDTAWLDELGAWPQIFDELGGTAFTNFLLGLRDGPHPLGIITTTPRAVPAVKQIMTDKTGIYRVSRMTTRANIAHLAPGFFGTLLRMFGGTRLYDQEVEGIYTEDVEGALWSTARLEGTRIVPLDHGIELAGMTEEDALRAKVDLVSEIAGGFPWRYVAVDPSFAEDGGGDECGMVVGGVGADRRFYVVGDYSGAMSPETWAERLSWVFHTAGCSAAVVEGNMAQSMTGKTIELVDRSIPKEWVHARNAKRARAEPVSVLWKDDPAQSLASMVGSLPGLEAECTGWDGKSNVSPNRIDALAWLGWKCFDHLFEGSASWSSQSNVRRLPV